MPKERPFDVWDGEDLGLTEPEPDDGPAEEVAMHIEADEEEGSPHWSELTDKGRAGGDGGDVRYFADEEPEAAKDGLPDEREPDLGEILHRQHLM